MARKPRLYGSSGTYHVILRGNNKQNLFNDDSDRNFFLCRLRKYSKELGVVVYAYCLMNNHVHILIGNASFNMSLLIQKLANKSMTDYTLEELDKFWDEAKRQGK